MKNLVFGFFALLSATNAWSQTADSLDLKRIQAKYFVYNEVGYLHRYDKEGDPNYNTVWVNGFFQAKKLLPIMSLAKIAIEDKKLGACANVGFIFPYGSHIELQPLSGRSIYEFNIGLKLNPTFSLDAGLLPSDFKLESLVGSQNINSTRSMSANSTYYNFLGARLNADIPNIKLRLSTFLVNTNTGIVKQTINQNSFQLGCSVQYGKEDDKLRLQSTLLVGRYDSIHKNSSERNFYYNMSWLSYQPIPAFKFSFSSDLGYRDFDTLYVKFDDAYFIAINAMAQVRILSKLKIGVRTQWLNDTEQKFISTTPFLSLY